MHQRDYGGEGRFEQRARPAVAASKAKLRKFLLRYYPPGIILEYEHDGELMQRSVDLLDLSPETDAEHLLDAIFARESMLRPSHREPLRALLAKLQTKLSDARHADFELFKVLRAHILPLTNCAFNKNGDAFVTGSYDRTCKVWDTASGEETHTLEGHKNVVYAVAFNNPFGDKVITGSFDKTCKLWDARTGELFYTLRGHETEIVCLGFDPSSTAIATGSMDASARLWDVETGRETCALRGHTAEIVSLSFSTSGNTLLTGSFDHDCRLWDARVGSCVRVLEGHRAEISAARFDFASGAAVSGSMDRGVRLWDLGSGRATCVWQDHSDEVLDVCFDAAGRKVASAGGDGTARVYDVASGGTGSSSACSHSSQSLDVCSSSVGICAYGARASKCMLCLVGKLTRGSCAPYHHN